MAFSPESGAPYGVYHSTFDSFEWMDSEGDPGFVRHVAMARLWGLVALRLAGDADADAPLPLNLTLQAEAIGGYISAAQAHARNVSSSNASRVNFGPLEAAHARFAAAAGKVGDEQRRVAKGAAPPGAAAALNEKLAYAERRFLSASGLPTRKYFRHVLQAPGLYTGYAPKTLPGVYDAVSAGDWATADAQARVAAERIDAAASFLLAE